MFIAMNVRPADKAELWSGSYSKPFDVMQRGIKDNPERSFTGWVDGKPICMWGVTQPSLIGNVGHPWMVGTRWLDEYAKTFLRRTGKQVMELMNGYDMLINYVDQRNVRAVEWLRWLGFTIEQPEPYGVHALPFHRFHKTGEEANV